MTNKNSFELVDVNEKHKNIIYCYSYYDKKSELFDTPFFTRGDIYAGRHFVMEIRKGTTMLSQFKDDMILYKIGSFDNHTGEIYFYNPPIQVIDGKSIERSKNNEISNES